MPRTRAASCNTSPHILKNPAYAGTFVYGRSGTRILVRNGLLIAV